MKCSPKTFGRIAVATFGLLAFSQAWAHHPMDGATPTTFWQGFLSGIGHPVIGIDHLAFILTVGLLAFSLRASAARLILPAAFALATVAGALAHVQAAALPWSETVIALSVLLGGLLVLARVELSVLVLSVAAGGFGVFHGYAYGEAIIGAEPTPLLAYLASFALMQFALIAGIAFGLAALARRVERAPVLLGRGGGVLATATGSLLLASNLS
jgi:urease accessory protein